MIHQTLKGFRDFLPKEARKRNYVINILRQTFESYGFEPLETPALEYEEVLAGKYGGEGQNLMYRFKDAGDRAVAMRYDQTVPLARVVAQYANDIPLPFKRYQVQPVWRAENTQKGRYREFLQCDIDTVGTASLFADSEIIATIAKGLVNLGVQNFKVLINDRSVFSNLDVASETGKVIRAIDKLKKVGRDEVIVEIASFGLTKEKAEEILKKVEDTGATYAVKTISMFLREMGVGVNKVVFSPTLARGLDYYTGSIFEVEIEGYDGGSVAGGGRYDNLIGMFADKQISAVGGSFGFDRLVEALDELGLFPANLQTSKVLVTVPSMKAAGKSLETANKLRSGGVNVEIYPDVMVALDKQLKYADKKQIPFVILFEGEKMLLKDMQTGEKKELPLDQIINTLS
jgi:histidyl-tRNA synthetase